MPMYAHTFLIISNNTRQDAEHIFEEVICKLK